MNHRWLRLFLLAFVVAFVLHTATAFAEPIKFTAPTAITDNGDDDVSPQISGGRVAWYRWDGNDYEVGTWKVGEGTVTPITEDDVDDYSPQVSGDRIVWYASDGNDDEIYTWKPGDIAASAITDNDLVDQDPQIAGDRVVWYAWDGNDYEVYTWKVGDSAVTQLTDNTDVDDYYPQIAGDRIVWYGWDGNDYEVFTWKVGDGSTTQITDDDVDDSYPQVSGDRVVWYGSDGNDDEIYTWKAGTAAITAISDNDIPDQAPQISGDRVVWYGSTGTDDEIYMWKVGDSAVTQLTDDDLDDVYPQISGDRVVWYGSDGVTDEIYTWKVGDSTITAITDNDVGDAAPEVSGDRLVWYGWDGNDWEIFTSFADPALNTYAITYNLNGGANPAGAPATYSYGIGAKLPTPNRVGYSFGGWYTNAALTGSPVGDIAASETGAKAFWAKWTANTYTITYNLNGGTNPAGAPVTYTYGIGATLPVPARAGYTFAGWFANSSFAPPAVVSVSTTDSGAKVFWARWTALPKVTLGTPTAPKTMKKSKYYTVYGSLKPKHTAGTKPVLIYKYKKVGGKWVGKGYVTAKAYNYKGYTRYKVKMKLTTKGSWRLRAYAPVDSKHSATWSKKYDYVKVK